MVWGGGLDYQAIHYIEMLHYRNVTAALRNLDCGDLLEKSLEIFIWKRSSLIYSVVSLLFTKGTNNT